MSKLGSDDTVCSDRVARVSEIDSVSNCSDTDLATQAKTKFNRGIY